MPMLHRLSTAAAWRLDRAKDVLRGRAGRHRAAARFAAVRKARAWRPPVGTPLVVVGLVEHLGDVVAAEPLVRWLRETNPDTHLAWAIRPAYRALVNALPYIDETIPVGCLTEWFGLRDRGTFGNPYRDPPADAGDRRFVDLHVAGRLCPTCGLRQRHPLATGVDATNYYRHGNLLAVFAAAAGLGDAFAAAVAGGFDDAPRVAPSAHDVAAVDVLGLPGRFVAVHGRSNQDVRDWRDERWRDLAARLRAVGLPVVEVGVDPVLPDAPGVTNLCGRVSVLQTAEVIFRAAAFVGVDSGPAHLANAVGTPGVILLGRYRSYERYMPYSGRYADGSNADVIQWDGPASEIPVGVVVDRVSARLRGAS